MPVVVVVGLLVAWQGSPGVVQVLLVGCQVALSVAVPLQLSLPAGKPHHPLSALLLSNCAADTNPRGLRGLDHFMMLSGMVQGCRMPRSL